MDKNFIGPEQLLEDAYKLAWKVFKSGFYPTYIIGMWRGGAPLAIAVHELEGLSLDELKIQKPALSKILPEINTRPL